MGKRSEDCYNALIEKYKSNKKVVRFLEWRKQYDRVTRMPYDMGTRVNPTYQEFALASRKLGIKKVSRLYEEFNTLYDNWVDTDKPKKE